MKKILVGRARFSNPTPRDRLTGWRTAKLLCVTCNHYRLPPHHTGYRRNRGKIIIIFYYYTVGGGNL